ncbi:MAG: response regulator transcription factor [Gammaproteobacteria bacterium]|nr:MAG: response regulator transcription factor [Gammaproteobacteria bacterium]
MRLLIVDDEALARRLMREYLASHTDIEIVGECTNGEAAVEEILKSNPELILLDIHMPKLSGLEVAELTGRTEGVIFTTAYDQYALKAFELHAVDYLLKPFSQTRFDEAIARAKKRADQDRHGISALVQEIKAERILVRDRGQTHIIPLVDIDYVEAEDDYIRICWKGKTILKTQSLSALEAQLNTAEFIRIHRSYIVKLGAIKGLERLSKDSQVVVLHSGVKLPISRTGLERIRPHIA